MRTLLKLLLQKQAMSTKESHKVGKIRYESQCTDTYYDLRQYTGFDAGGRRKLVIYTF